MCGSAEGIKEGMGSFGGAGTKSLGPGFSPTDIVIAGCGIDGECGKMIEESLASRSDVLTGWIWRWLGGHGRHIACSCEQRKGNNG